MTSVIKKERPVFPKLRFFSDIMSKITVNIYIFLNKKDYIRKTASFNESKTPKKRRGTIYSTFDYVRILDILDTSIKKFWHLTFFDKCQVSWLGVYRLGSLCRHLIFVDKVNFSWVMTSVIPQNVVQLAVTTFFFRYNVENHSKYIYFC